MSKVFIGVGHGGTDPGAVANGLKEKNLNLVIASACADVLLSHGVEIKMSRKKDENDTLKSEVKECNAFNPDYAIDIHINAYDGRLTVRRLFITIKAASQKHLPKTF